MAKTSLVQFSFNRGEIDPALRGRGDWKYHPSGAGLLRNMVPTTRGAAVKRSGTRFVALALSQKKPSFFIPFHFSARQSYMLEMGDFRMRIIQDGAFVAYPEGHPRQGEIVVVATPYSSDDLPALRCAQKADLMYFALASKRPRTLRRFDHHDWRWDELDFAQTFFPPENLRLDLDGLTEAQYVVSAVKPDGTESEASDMARCGKAGGVAMPANVNGLSYRQCVEYLRGAGLAPAYDIDAMGYEAAAAFLGQIGYPPMYMQAGNTHYIQIIPADGSAPHNIQGAPIFIPPWDAFTGVMRTYAEQRVNEGAGNVITVMRQQVVDHAMASGEYATGHSRLAWNPAAGASAYYVYRSVDTDDGAKFFYIGSTSGTTFDDDNLAYDSSRGIVANPDNPFSAAGEYPGVAALFEQRLIYARTDKEPVSFWGSVTGDHLNFSHHTPYQKDDSFDFTLASGDMNEILWMANLDDLIIGTAGAEWRVSGNGEAISPLNVSVRLQSSRGCAPMNPLKIGRAIVFLGRSRRRLYALSYSLESNGYAGRDLTAYAGHLLDRREIVSMAHQEDRDDIIWAVTDDGALLSCTWNQDEDVIAWAEHATDGRFESVQVLKDLDGTDQTYCSVAREAGGTTMRCVELLEPLRIPETPVEDAFFVDSGLSYGGENGPVREVGGLEHLEGKTVAVLADGHVLRGLAVENGRIAFPNGEAFSRVHAGLPYAAELETLELEPPEGGTLRNRPRWTVNAAVRLLDARECWHSLDRRQNPKEMKFRTEGFDSAIQPFTGEKTALFSPRPDARSAKIYLASGDPVPFSVSMVVAEAGYGSP